MIHTTPLEEWIRGKISHISGMNAYKSGNAHSFSREQGPLTRALLESYQLVKLRDTIRLARSNSSFYRDRLAEFPPEKIKSLRDLQSLPFTTADDIRESPMRFVCCSQDEIRRIVTLESSGTTGLPKRIFFTADDQELTKDFFHHALGVVAKPGDKVLVLLPGERPGSVGELFADGALRMDVTPVAHGFVQDPEEALGVMEREKIDTLLGTPVQVLALASYEAPGENKFRTHVKNVILNTDHAPKAVTKRIQQKWSCRVFNHYAMTEMGLGGGLECEAFDGYHMREADLLFEVVDPVTGETLPDGEEGEVVFTTLTRQAMPLIRYRTGDFGRLIPEPCPCGTVLKRMGRVKDRLTGKVVLAGGGFISMSVLDEVLFSIPGVVNLRAVISSASQGDALSVQVQATAWSASTTVELVRNALLAIPVVAQKIRDGMLVVQPVEVDFSASVWRPAKRCIQDIRIGSGRK
ncbi:AMP-binding protein [Alicyclobacillus tolerans]|uniref:DVU_1553 family AMP-dependent CoA ligase n=1 Tax=Alicyclobacillus tolerans TaxID=90970 RepID=UPI001F19FB08|nr:AMP-binding protein [Alicyclobacillus tolerans]MCF8567244.1 AMP-binding protein [Alicyclobacillus tolerans]